MTSPAYTTLEERFRKLYHFEYIGSILSWDEATMMPPGAGTIRAEASASLNVLRHEMLTDPKNSELIQKAKSETESLDAWQRRNLELMERRFVLSRLLSSEIVAERTKATSECEQTWRVHRQSKDWKAHEPHLKRVVNITREIASVLAEKKELSKYDALLDEYEHGMRSSIIDPIFKDLESFLPSKIDEVIELQRSQNYSEPLGSFSISSQQSLAESLMKSLGFSFQNGRLDASVHPFCGGEPEDVRITSRFNTQEFITALCGVLHETGHAKYNQNLPSKWIDQPIGNPLGMAIHESQSLFTEMQICRGKDFLTFAAPVMREHFKDEIRNPESLKVDNLYQLITRVKKSYIRVDADEMTYPLHIVLRYNIERDLIEGKLEVDQIPEAWNEYSKRYFGLETIHDHLNGCMQDIHWPVGLMGYFPCYTLGALIAAQIYQRVSKEIPDLAQNLQTGDFTKLNEWLINHIYKLGSLKTGLELIKDVSGENLGAEAFKGHIQNRYLSN